MPRARQAPDATICVRYDSPRWLNEISSIVGSLVRVRLSDMIGQPFMNVSLFPTDLFPDIALLHWRPSRTLISQNLNSRDKTSLKMFTNGVPPCNALTLPKRIPVTIYGDRQGARSNKDN